MFRGNGRCPENQVDGEVREEQYGDHQESVVAGCPDSANKTGGSTQIRGGIRNSPIGGWVIVHG